MVYTVADFLASYEGRVRLLAGQGGLLRPINQVGILDYELVPGLKTRYQRVNFEPEQLVLTSLLYARDDPWLIGEAVRYLVNKASSALVIKNVFGLDIPDSALRYADARDFPVLITTADDFFFDHVIADVNRRVSELADATFAQSELDALCAPSTTPEEARAHALRLGPSLSDEHLAVFVAADLGHEELVGALERYAKSCLAGPGRLLTYYEGGLLYVASASSDVLKLTGGAEHLTRLLRADILELETTAAIGVSEVHYSLAELGHAVLEARRAASVAQRRQSPTVSYGELGVLRALLPFANQPQMRAFSDSILEPLRDFDAATGSSLVKTLEAYVDQGQSVEATARELGQHPNTIRYRLDKISQVTGLAHRQRTDMDQLALARSIALCQELLKSR